jgi:cleavage stimulation factor subunit 1
VRGIDFHPSGDYLLVATNHPATRLYDVRTGQCFVCSIASHHHAGPVLSAK